MATVGTQPIQKDNRTSESNEQISTHRRILPQLLASQAKNLIILDIGMSIAIPSIVIPALTGLNKDNNPDEIIHLTAEQSSWLGSIPYICQPVGSLVSGWITEPIGRKRAMLVVNVPYLIAWLILWNSSTVWEIFLANIFMGLGVGLAEAPILTYVGEICQPSVRGLLIALSHLSHSAGIFLVFLLGNLTAWRNVALVCSTVPIITHVAIAFIPETPLWLLSKSRPADALTSLQWLRGWTTPATVQIEFNALQKFNEQSNACGHCTKSNIKCTHAAPGILHKFNELKRQRNLKPFVLMMALFAIANFSGFYAMRPFLVQILKAYGTPISANKASVNVALFGTFGTITSICAVKLIGKRVLFLFSLGAACIAMFSLSLFGFQYLPSDLSSFNQNNVTGAVIADNSYFPMHIFMTMSYFSSAGVAAVPWMLISELFPFKSRGFATGITAAGNYILSFIATKTYFNLETWLSLPGVALFYTLIGSAGLILMIIFLPETEGCTLDDIETHFSDNNRRLRDIKIRKSNPIRENGGQQQAANAEYALDASDNNEMRVTSGSAVLEMVTSANQRTTSKGRDNCGYDDEEL